MYRKIILCLGILVSQSLLGQNQLIDYVNPIIGTNGMGHTFPGACAPFGIVQLSSETDTIPHNLENTKRRFMNTVLDISMATRPSWASATRI